MSAACAAVERKAHLTIQRTLQMKDAVYRWSRGTVSTTSRLKIDEGKTNLVVESAIRDPEAGESTGKE